MHHIATLLDALLMNLYFEAGLSTFANEISNHGDRVGLLFTTVKCRFNNILVFSVFFFLILFYVYFYLFSPSLIRVF